jgi:hypothetical protein
MSAERGYGLIVLGRAPVAGSTPCPSFAEAEIVPLEEALLTLVSQSLEVMHWPPPAAAPTSRGAFSAQGRSIPTLDGLHLAARFFALAEGADRVEGKGQRKPTFAKKLVGWGFWAEGTQ